MLITREAAAKVLQIVDAGLSSGLGVPKPGQMCVEAAVCYALGLPHDDRPGCVEPTLRSLKIRLNDAEWSSKAARARGLRRLALAQLGSAGHLDEYEFRRRVVGYALRVSCPQALRSAASIHKNADHRAALLDAAARCEREASREAAVAARKAANAANAYAAAAANAANAAYDAAYAAANAAYDAANAAAYAAAANAANAAANAARAAATAAYAAAAANAVNAANAANAAYAAANAANAAANAATNAANAAANAAKKKARDKSLSEYAEAVVQILIEMKAPGCQWLDLAPIQEAVS